MNLKEKDDEFKQQKQEADKKVANRKTGPIAAAKRAKTPKI